MIISDVNLDNGCPFGFKLFNMDSMQFNPTKIVRLVGNIDEEKSEAFLADLREMAASEAEGGITIVIHSDGGTPDDAMRILDAIQMLKERGLAVHTIVTGKAYSMAAIIYCMGDYRTIYPNGLLMFHSSRYPELQDYDVTGAKLMDLYNELKVFDDRFFAIMSATGVPKELVEKSKTSDVYFSAEDAVKYGIAHSIEREIL